MNIAIHRKLFNSHCQVVHTAVLRVKQFLGHSIYDLEVLRSSTGFRPDGTIDWDQKAEPPMRIGKYGTLEPPQDVKGWRDPSADDR